MTCLDWRKNVLAAKIKMFWFHTSKIKGSGSEILVLFKKSVKIRALSQSYKKIFALTSDWENIIAYWEKFKQSEALADKCDSFNTESLVDLGVGSPATGKFCNFLYPDLSLETVFPALKLTWNCYLSKSCSKCFYSLSIWLWTSETYLVV